MDSGKSDRESGSTIAQGQQTEECQQIIKGTALSRMIHKCVNLNVAGVTDNHILSLTLSMTKVDLHTETPVVIGTITKHADADASQLETLWIILLVLTW